MGNPAIVAGSRRLVILLALTVGLSTGPARAQHRWVGVGPYGGVVNSVAIDPTDSNFLYAGSDGGLFVSRDGGENWTAAAGVRSRTGSIAVDPSSPSTVFAIAERRDGGALLRTRNRGETWEPVGNEITCLRAVRGVAFSGPSTLVVREGSPSTVFVATCAGVFRSADDGETWALGSMGIPDRSSSATFAVGFAEGGRLYLGIDPLLGGRFPGPGVLVSDDDGQSWSPSNEGLPDFATVTAVTVDPLDSRNVYVGVVTRPGPSAPTGQGVFKSTDAGETWSATGLTSTHIDQIAIDTSDPQQILATAMGVALSRSEDGGATWESMDSLGSLLDLVADPADPQRFYYSSHEGLFRSDDAGSAWQQQDTGIGATTMRRILFEDQLPGTRFAADANTWVRSDSVGDWSEVRGGTIFFIDPTNPEVMYSNSPVGIGVLFAPPLERSDDGGATWVERTRGLPTPPSSNPLSGIVASLSLAINPTDPGRLVLAIQIIDVGIESAELRIFVSDNGGDLWTPATEGPDFPAGLFMEATLAMDPADPAKVYLFSFFRGLYRSLDHGETWSKVSEAAVEGIHSFAIAPSENGNSRLFVSTAEGVYGSDDHGQTWQPLLSELAPAGVRLIVADRAEPNKVYVSEENGGILATADSGNTWCTVNAEALPSAARDLAIASAPTRQLCAATTRSSVLCLDLPELNGDCNSDGHVRVAELVLAVRINLGQAEPSDCPGVDSNADSEVSVAELIAAVGNALDPSRACGA